MSAHGTPASLRVNGQQVDAREGENLLQQLKALGLAVPSMCFHPESASKERPVRCGLCVVEVNGEVRASCTEQVSNGLVVKTDTPQITQARKENLEALMADHYSEEMCANCIWDSGCLLHIMAAELGFDLDALAR